MLIAGSDITIEILKEILDEIRGVRTEMHELRIDTNVHLGGVRSETHGLRADTNERFGVVETALLDLIEGSHSIAGNTRALSERDARREPRLSVLEDRVAKLESK